jgi:hypothetical protein
MIIFGTRGKTVAGQYLEGIECPSCKNNQFATFGILRYFHLFWIPTFPTSRVAGVECRHCKKTLVGKELPKQLSKQIKSTVFNKKNTLPMFFGLIVITLFVLFLAYSIQQDNIKEAAYIEQPAINDLYIVNFTKVFDDADPDYSYGVMRVKHLSSNQVELQVSKIGYNKVSGVQKDIRNSKTTPDSYYDGDPLYIEIDKLKEMKESGAIYSVDRI